MQCIARFESHRAFGLRPFVLAFALACASTAHAAPTSPALPQGGQFVAGSGAITNGAQSMTIDQTSARGVIDWHSFSIGTSHTVSFDNGTGATLNRVTGGDASIILGTLKGTGSVYVLNPQGVLIGRSGVVATGGRFVASSLDGSVDAFMKGSPLTLAGGGDGVVVNLGKIGSSGGDVFLIARSFVGNRGSIDAPKGSAELAAGSQVTLRDSASGQQVMLTSGSGGTVANAGMIDAAQVNLQAADGNVFALAGNHAAIRATGTATRDGHVWLVADEGQVHANGIVIAKHANGSGGEVDTRAKALDLAGAIVQAGTWTLYTPAFTIDATAARAISRSLGAGTSVDVTASGDIALNGNVQWNGNASLKLDAAHSVSIAQGVAIRNAGGADLTVRADANAIDNGGGIVNKGAIDWSRSTGIVSLLYDMNGSYSAGTLLANHCWTAAPFSALVTQITAYKLVNTLADLENIALDLKGNYALGKDIALSTKTNFVTLAPTDTTPFTGQLDGFGHVISNLTIKVPENAGPMYAGLFGMIGASGVVRNLGLANASIEDGYGRYYGIIAGRSDGKLAHVWSTGDVGSGEPYAGVSSGGLVAWNKGTIERSWSSASVGGEGAAGGLAYQNDGLIVQSYSTGDASAIGTHESGAGLVYTNNGTIRQSYAAGIVDTLIGDGSMVGYNSGTGVIEESFNAGKAGQQLTLDTYGAIASENSGTIRNNVYWDKQITNHKNAVTDSFGGTAPPASNGLTTAQMSDAANFVSWSFGSSGVWALPSGATHPVLQWQVSGH